MGTEKSPSSAFHFDEGLFLAPCIYFSHFHQRLGRLSNVLKKKRNPPPEERRKKEGSCNRMKLSRKTRVQRGGRWRVGEEIRRAEIVKKNKFPCEFGRVV